MQGVLLASHAHARGIVFVPDGWVLRFDIWEFPENQDPKQQDPSCMDAQNGTPNLQKSHICSMNGEPRFLNLSGASGFLVGDSKEV